MSRQEMEETRDQLRQICRNKYFNVATNSSASDQDKKRFGGNKEKFCGDNRPRQL